MQKKFFLISEDSRENSRRWYSLFKTVSSENISKIAYLNLGFVINGFLQLFKIIVFTVP